jgi:hypothetical protein
MLVNPFPAPLPIFIPFTVTSVPKVTVFVNVFAPANVCAPVVTIPPFVASAGVKINSVVPLIVAPLAFEVAEITPIELNPAFAATIEFLTYSVVATFVELSLVAGVGAVGVPVNAGEAIVALNKISDVFAATFVFNVVIAVSFAVMLAVFAATFVFNVAMLFPFAVMLTVFAATFVFSVAIAVSFAVILAVFAATFVFSVAIAVSFAVILAAFAATFVFSVAMLFTFAVMLAVFAATFVFSVAMLFPFAVILAVFAATFVGNAAIALALTPPTEFTVVAKDPFPEPDTSPVKVVVKFAAITSVPITKPKLVLASAGLAAPVPPFKTASVPLIFAEVILLSATPAFALC